MFRVVKYMSREGVECFLVMDSDDNLDSHYYYAAEAQEKCDELNKEGK